MLGDIIYWIIKPFRSPQSESFPHYGKHFRDFSTQWKNFGRFFHTMEKVFGIFPHNGKNVSTLWKTRFYGCFQGLLAALSGLLSGARGAPCEP